jgi:hypothetical protein
LTALPITASPWKRTARGAGSSRGARSTYRRSAGRSASSTGLSIAGTCGGDTMSKPARWRARGDGHRGGRGLGLGQAPAALEDR